MKLTDILIVDDNMAGLETVLVITPHGRYNVPVSDYSNQFLKSDIKAYTYCETRCGNGDLITRKAIFVTKEDNK